MNLRGSLSLRVGFLLVLLFGAILPLGLVGLWLNRSAARSGEELVRERLERGLREVIAGIGARWVTQRTTLLEIAEHPEVRRALRSPAAETVDGAPTAALAELFQRTRDFAEAVVVRDNTGASRWRTTLTTGELPSGMRFAAVLPTELPVYDDVSGARIGTLEARIFVSRLAPGSGGWYGIGGSVLGLFDGETGEPVLPLTIDAERFRQARFSWANESWLGVSHSLREPPLEIVLAAPLGPFTQPFERAARKGTLALIAIALVAFVLATLVTGRITRSLRQLAVAAEAVTVGDLKSEVEESGGDEVRRVAHAFNAMVRSLRETLFRLAQRESLAAVGGFASSLAHDVRNPLTSIRLVLQKAEERSLDPECKRLIAKALASVEGLNRTVSGALSIAQSGLVDAEIIDVRAPLEAAARTAEPEFQARGATLELTVTAASPVRVQGDAAALEGVFLNLLRNAAQVVGEGGRAEISLETSDDWAAVSIVDNGPGIPEQDLERVFEPFYSTKEEGTGLGLAIARQTIRAHGGEIAIESEVGAGTVVRIRLPLARQT
jgi:signal transduction histidine kinase